MVTVLTLGTVDEPAHLFKHENKSCCLILDSSINQELKEELEDTLQTKFVDGRQLSYIEVSLSVLAMKKFHDFCGLHVIIYASNPLCGIFKIQRTGDWWMIVDILITHHKNTMTFEAEQYLMLKNINEKLDAHLNAVNQLIQLLPEKEIKAPTKPRKKKQKMK